MTSETLSPPSTTTSSEESSSSSFQISALKAALPSSSSTSSSATDLPCLYHSHSTRPILECCINLLRKNSSLKPSTFPLRSTTCSCSASSSSPARQAPSSFNPSQAISSLPEPFRPVQPVLKRLSEENPQQERVKAFIYLFSLVAQGLSLPPLKESPPAPSITFSTEEKEAQKEEKKEEELPMLSQTIEITLHEAFIGVFISKNGFTSLLSPLSQLIHVHCGTYSKTTGSLPITISAVSMETINQVAAALRSRATSVTVTRERHLQSLKEWAQKTKQRQIQRKNRVLSAEETEHRFRSRLESSKNHVAQVNLKMIATSHYQRSLVASNGPREVSARQKRQLGREEKILAHEISREQGLCCIQCSVGFKKELAAGDCSFHPGYVVGREPWLRGKAAGAGTWSCCGRLTGSEPCKTGKHAWHSKVPKEVKEGKVKEKERTGKRRANAKLTDFSI